MIRRWWALVLTCLRARRGQTVSELPPVSDHETAPLAQDSWRLCGDLARHSLLPCTLVRAPEDGRHR
jgi:hypothetical protein